MKKCSILVTKLNLIINFLRDDPSFDKKLDLCKFSPREIVTVLSNEKAKSLEVGVVKKLI